MRWDARWYHLSHARARIHGTFGYAEAYVSERIKSPLEKARHRKMKGVKENAFKSKTCLDFQIHATQTKFN